MQGLGLIAASGVVFLYVLAHPLPGPLPAFPPGTGSMALPAHEILFTIVLFLGIAGWGRLWKREGAGPLTRLLEGLVAGCLGVSLLLLGMGLLGLLNRGTLGAVGLLIALRAPAALVDLKKVVRRHAAPQPLFLLLWVMILPAFARSLCPPTTWDTLMYHLAAPRAWLEAGAIRPDAPVFLAHYPAAQGMLYLLGMALTGDRVPGLIHFGFFLASLAAIASLGRSLIGGIGGLWAALTFAGFPIVHRTAGDALADQVLIFATLMAMTAVLRHLRSGDVTDVTRAAVAAGLACSAKYQGIHVSFALFVVLYLGQRARGAVDPRALGRFVAIGALVASPWYLKSLWFTGNPFHQAGNRSVHARLVARGVDGGRLPRLKDGHFSDHPDLEHLDYFSEWASYGHGYGPVDLVKLPFQLSIDSHDAPDETAYSVYGGEASPLLLAFLPLLPFVPRWRRFWPFLLAGALLAMIVSVQSQQCRYYLPAFALLSIPAAVVPTDRGLGRRTAAALAIVAWLWAIPATWWTMLRRGDAAAAAGLLDRAAYLERNLDHAKAFRFANHELLRGSVLFLGFEPRTYHLRVPHRGGDPLGLLLREIVLSSKDATEIVAKLRATGATHLHVPLRFIPVLATSSRDPALPAKLKDLFGRVLQPVYQDEAGLIYRLP